jgi:hypothetical protein
LIEADIAQHLRKRTLEFVVKHVCTDTLFGGVAS